MGIADTFGKLAGRFEAARRAFVLGPGVVDPYETAMGHDTSKFTDEAYGDYIVTSSAVYSCVTLKANLFKGLNFKPYKLGADGTKVEVTKGNLVNLLRKFNPFWSMRRALEMYSKSMGLWGKNFWFCERGESGKMPPREIWWGRPDRVKIVPDEVNYIKKFLYYPVNSTVPLVFDPWEVIWFRYGNPLDEYEGLAPVAAARIAADLRSSAFQSNKKLFDQGMQLGGAITPPKGSTLEKEQAREIEEMVNKRFTGVERAHRWAVFRYEFDMKQQGINARDAEFLGTLNLTLEEVARVYGIPLDLVGGERTYENVEASERAIWTRTLKPEAEDFAAELTEQLLPMFPGEADIIEPDLSEVEVLHESETAAWERDKGKIETGAKKINEWRKEQGLEPVPWGDVWWAQGTLRPVKEAEEEFTAEDPENTEGEEENLTTKNTKGTKGEEEENADEEDNADEEGTSPPPSPKGKGAEEEAARDTRPTRTRAWVGMKFGSEEHARAWRAFERKAVKWERRTREMVVDLFRRQKESVLARMGDQRAARTADEAAKEPFNRKEWIRKFRIEMRALLEDLLEEVGEDAFDEIPGGNGGTFDVKAPAVRRFMERRAQRFAQEVNETTWNLLRESLAAGLEDGDGLQKLMERVESVMGERIQSSSETIARTEAVGAMNGGKLEAWKQADQLYGTRTKKTWLAELDDRTRESHVEAHRRYQAEPIDKDEDFEVGGVFGPGPGELGDPGEDINCRCTMQPVVEEEEI